jgi:hypothetical protein
MSKLIDRNIDQPWPQHLRVFDPAKHCRVAFFRERASIARSLGRKVLPEIISMSFPDWTEE